MSHTKNNPSDDEKKRLEEELKRGYQEMAELNLELAELCFDADQEAYSQYEEKLTECE